MCEWHAYGPKAYYSPVASSSLIKRDVRSPVAVQFCAHIHSHETCAFRKPGEPPSECLGCHSGREAQLPTFSHCRELTVRRGQDDTGDLGGGKTRHRSLWKCQSRGRTGQKGYKEKLPA